LKLLSASVLVNAILGRFLNRWLSQPPITKILLSHHRPQKSRPSQDLAVKMLSCHSLENC